jgi:hypothetical protein
MRCSYYSQSLVRIRGANRETRVGFEGVDPRALFIPSCPGVTGLTRALDQSDQCKTLVRFISGNCLICVVCPMVQLVSSWLVWSCFVRFCEGFSFGGGFCSRA